MLEKDYKFSGSFEAGCEQNTVPNSLVDLIHMILEGPSLITLKVLLVHQDTLFSPPIEKDID